MQPPPKKLLDQVRDAIRLKHYAYRTEETYGQWIRRFILLGSLTQRYVKRHGMGPTFSPDFDVPNTIRQKIAIESRPPDLAVIDSIFDKRVAPCP